ncbi:MFS transporter [Alicyclobacillus fastidiosus]|uniref:MFS transporter n=1 Tax=Alicyclobacillus fastidiosus TaxID=392011 RepID=A0ABY6ZJT9_9BACL|nr:MFS transporter [Alicyclobacillus fastidiosus]WAH43204.1 MFS transporter [Alicyclobacillus fastidiosus]GMA65237.1 putative MFS-type transporter YxlH [Alicyclobacillus fastidiosus]
MATNRITLFYIVTMFYWFSTYTYVPLLSPYVLALGGSLAMSGVIIGSYGFSQMLVRIPLGVWSDRVGSRKPFIIGGVAVGTLSSLGFALTSSVWAALICRLLAGVAAASWVVFTVLYASYHSDESAPKAMGIISFFTSIGQLLATTLGGIVAQRFGWHAAFWLAVVGGTLGFLMSFGIKDNPPAKDAKGIQPKELIAVGRDKIVLGVSILAVLAQIITFSTMFGFTPEDATHLGASKIDLSWLTLASTLPNALASLYSGGILSRKLGERNVVVIGFALSAIFTCVIPTVHSLNWLYVTQAANGLGQGLCMPVLMGLAIKHIDSARRATAMGFYQAIYSLGMFGGPSLVGWIGESFSLNTGFFCVATISLFAAMCTFVLAPKPHARRGPTMESADIGQSTR